MSRNQILKVLSSVLMVTTITLIFPLVVGLLYAEKEAKVFLAIIVSLMIISYIFSLFKDTDAKHSTKSGFLVVGLSWLLITIIGALPFYFSGAIPNFFDCIFESASGFTTTGASILNEIDSLPKSILFWRAETHFIGGLGILVFMVALIPLADQRNIYMLKAEMPGPSVGKLKPKLRDNMKISVITYVVLSITMLICLLCCRLPLFDAITTTMATAGTGGFMIYNESVAYYHSVGVDVVCTIFMILFGVNFNFYFFLYLKQWKQTISEEVRWYFVVIFGAITLIVWNSWHMFNGFWDALHHVSFTVASTISTTGFVITNYELWPAFSRNIILLLMFCGACGGSTGGGIKVSRLILMFKQMTRDISRMLNPRSVHVVTMDGKAVEEDVTRDVYSFMMVYVVLLVVGTLLVSLDGTTFETSLTAVITCINNVGPGFGMVGPICNFSGFSNFAKMVLSLIMLLGRLEIFPMLLLFSPALYKFGK